jgi:hypothetical protein
MHHGHVYIHEITQQLHVICPAICMCEVYNIGDFITALLIRNSKKSL